MLAQDTTLELQRPKTPTQFNFFDQVFVNSLPLDKATLQTANELLNLTIDSRTIPSIPVRQYIRKLTIRTEQLRARSIVY